MPSMTSRPSLWWSFGTGMVLGVILWSTSPFITGMLEPWDVEGFYYPLGLMLVGFLATLVDPQRFWLAPLGILCGECFYLFGLFLFGPQSSTSPLIILGFVILIIYRIPAYVGAMIGYAFSRALRSKSHS